jgi:hypothetical protein
MEPLVSLPVAARAAELHRRIHGVKYPDQLGVRGLTLRVGYLAAWGVDPKILSRMQHGFDLDLLAAPPKRRKNHPSCKVNADLVHSEYVRLHAQGSISWLGKTCPDGLNVNLCAMIVKNRDDGSVKARLIMDLSKGGANERVRKIPVRYGSVDRAVNMMSKNRFIFVIDLADCFWH